jgi:hypothetical protein
MSSAILVSDLALELEAVVRMGPRSPSVNEQKWGGQRAPREQLPRFPLKATKMTPAQIAEAQRMAREWKPTKAAPPQ